MLSDNLKPRQSKVFEATITTLKAIWYFPNYLSKVYYTSEQTTLKALYYYRPNVIKNSLKKITPSSSILLNRIYSETKPIIMHIPNAIYNNSPLIIQNYLDGAAQVIFKSIPKPYEIVTGAIRPSVLKYMMSPLEQAIGDNANLFSWIMDFTRIFTFQDFAEKEIEVSNTGMKYSHLHIEAAKISFVIKISSILGGISYNGLKNGSLTSAVTKGNFISEPFSKGFIVVAEKKFKMKHEDLDSYELIKTYGEKSWIIEIFIGGLSRVYVSNNIGSLIEKTGVNKAARNLGNTIETEAVKLIDNNTVTFNNSDNIITKYTKIIEYSEENIFEQIKWLPVMIPIAFIDIIARYTPYSLGGIPLVTTTRMVCFSFQKLIDKPYELNGFEYTIISLVSLSAANSISPYVYDLYNYIYPETENISEEYDTPLLEINELNDSLAITQQDEL